MYNEDRRIGAVIGGAERRMICYDRRAEGIYLIHDYSATVTA